VNFRRFLRPEAIRLELRTRRYPEAELPRDFDLNSPGNLRRIREGVLEELTELFANTGEVANPSRLFRDLYNREKKAVTAIGQGIAVPHVRTLQMKSFIMAFGRSREGIPFAAPDDEPVHLFFAMAAPPYDDRTYLKVYRSLASALLTPGTIESFLEAEDVDEILLSLKQVG
jgi:PTS system fructose-specific IIC component